jgi:predicted nucleic acid-binding protein
MPKIISNTSCLIALSNIGKLALLHDIYGTVIITPEVAREFREALPEWILVVPVSDSHKTKLIEKTLDLGEASTIALAMETDGALLILDDGKARRFAKSIGLRMTGTLGVTVKAYKSGLISDLGEIIAAFRQHGFRIPNEIEAALLDVPPK